VSFVCVAGPQSVLAVVCNVVSPKRVCSVHFTMRSACERRNTNREWEIMQPGGLLVEWLRARIVLIKIKRVPHHRARAGMSNPGAGERWFVVWLRLPRNVARLLRLTALAGELTRIRCIVC
jgi:hypothetical protein